MKKPENSVPVILETCTKYVHPITIANINNLFSDQSAFDKSYSLSLDVGTGEVVLSITDGKKIILSRAIRYNEAINTSKEQYYKDINSMFQGLMKQIFSAGFYRIEELIKELDKKKKS